ncbi:putative peptidyl-arginine deiminase family protein [Xylaria grammica]|nr:putative peptidyl-arginine deiminase family protein [Xylaria grammica]
MARRMTLGNPSGNEPITLAEYNFRIPAETDLHAGTIMNWPTKSSILNADWKYASADVNQTWEELADIAAAITKYEPLELFVRDPSVDGGAAFQSAKKLLGGVENVTIHTTRNVDSLWARDTSPVFVYASRKAEGHNRIECTEREVGIILNFNQWGKKEEPTVDSYFAGSACETLNKPQVLAPFIAEGGAIETDGEGTLLTTESAILNPNRNPGVDKRTMERYFKEVFGISKTTWLPGRPGGDITDDHIDALARFASPGVVILSRPYTWHLEDHDRILDSYYDMKQKLEGQTDAKGRTIQAVDLPDPNPGVLGDISPESGPSVSYANYHVVNGAVIVAAFGDEVTDSRAVKILAQHYPGRVIEQVPLRQLGIQGGGIHCSTSQFYQQ